MNNFLIIPGEKPYGCEFCPMRFTALGTLKNHTRTHTGEKPHMCTYCDRAFTQKLLMKGRTLDQGHSNVQFVNHHFINQEL